MRSLFLQVITGRWFVVFASFQIMWSAGATCTFGLFSGRIKSALGYDQTTLNLLSFFKDFGANLGVLSGLINQVTPPWVVLSMGAALDFLGYFMIWLAVSRKIAEPQVWQMCLYISIGANSQSFANTGALVTCVKNFPANRGAVLGLVTGYVGLSGAIITQFYHALYGNDDPMALILLIAWLPAAVTFAFLWTFRIMKVVRRRQENDELKVVLYKFLYISLALAGFLMIMIIVEKQLSFQQSVYGGIAALLLLMLLLPLAVVVIPEEFKLWKIKVRANPMEPSPPHPPPQLKIIITGDSKPPESAVAPPPPAATSNSLTQQPCSEIINEASCFSNVFRPPARGEDHTILQALFSLDMLILFFSATWGIGGTLTAIDNLGQIGTALGYPQKSISTLVSLVSIWNYLGRVTAGFGSEIILHKYKFPRPLILTLILLLACVGHLLIAFNIKYGLYLASIIIGFCAGAQWSVLFTVISEIFGLKHLSKLYSLGALASPIGVYVLNVRVAGHLYDKEAKRRMDSQGDREYLYCAGVECFKLAFIIITAATLFGSLASLILVIRTRKFYKGDIYNKFREQARVAGPGPSLAEG